MQQLRTETAHRLMDYDGRCAHLHGHSYLWEVTAGNAVLTPNGMIADFKHLKAAMMEVLDPLDHALVLHEDDPLVKIAKASGGPASDLFRATNGEEARFFMWDVNPTAENFAEWAFLELQKVVYKLWNEGKIKHMEIKGVKVWETATSFAEYKG